MFYKICVGLAVGIFVLSLIGASSNASSLTLRQQNYVDNAARTRVRTTHIVPVPRTAGYSSGGGGSSRSSYDGYRGGGPGSGK